MAAPLVAKAALALAKSKKGRKVLAGALVAALVLPLVAVAVPIIAVGAVVSSVIGAAGADSAQAVGGGGGGCVIAGAATCTVSSDAQALAQEIMAAASAGTVSFIDPRHEDEVRAYATGQPVTPACFLDVRLLQVIVLVRKREGRIGISSLNRRCTGETPGAGTASYHWKGLAVDFYSFAGTITTGADSNAITVIQFLDPLMPAGSAVGQSNCRALYGTTVPLTNFHTFPDSCTHLHVQLSDDSAPLHLPVSTAPVPSAPAVTTIP